MNNDIQKKINKIEKDIEKTYEIISKYNQSEKSGKIERFFNEIIAEDREEINKLKRELIK